MGHFLGIAFQVLKEIGHPLSVREITETGVRRGWLQTKGKTPYQTMKAKLSTDILAHKERSFFMRTSKGQIGLREWTDRYQEYFADRFKKALLDEDIVVFPASSLSKYVPAPGLHAGLLERSEDLLRECSSLRRRAAEQDFGVVQLVSAFVVKFGDLYLTYKRTKRLPESRLHGCHSLVFGGHLNPSDILPLYNVFQPQFVELALLRELKEEIRFPDERFPALVYKGLLYDDSRELSRQHLGIVYDVILKSDEYEIGERGFLMDAKFETLDDITGHLSDFENWSALIVQHELSALD